MMRLVLAKTVSWNVRRRFLWNQGVIYLVIRQRKIDKWLCREGNSDFMVSSRRLESWRATQHSRAISNRLELALCEALAAFYRVFFVSHG